MGTIAKSSLTQLLHTVRARSLELTIQLEKSIPAAAEISLGPPAMQPAPKDKEIVTRITQQIVHGNLTHIGDNVQGDQLNLQVRAGDSDGFVKALVREGILEKDAKALGSVD
jgi:hypothetical protein